MHQSHLHFTLRTRRLMLLLVTQVLCWSEGSHLCIRTAGFAPRTVRLQVHVTQQYLEDWIHC